MMSSPAQAESSHFPVPWSRVARDQLPRHAQRYARALEQAGFEVITWDDRTQAGVEWFAERQKRARAKAKRSLRHCSVCMS